MKKTFIAAFLLIMPFFISAQDYKLMWEDNFENPTLNEAQHWTIEVNGNGGGNNELQYYRRENISVEKHPDGDGCLVISAKKESFGGKLATSGRLVTLQKVSAKYGKIEARIQLPSTANGLWPAFWLMGNDFSTVGWPRCGEIDVMEMGNINGINRGTQDRYFNGACHWGENWTYYAKDNTAAYSLQDGFHLYTLIWDENAIKMYLDQDVYPNTSPYFEMSIAGQQIPGLVSNYFHKPFGILLNLAVGGNFTGITGNSNIDKITALQNNGTPTKMYIDYVRIYQKGAANEIYNGPALMADTEKPTTFTASVGAVKATTVELLLKAADNSGTVFYDISYGAKKITVSGTSNVEKKHMITGLTPETNYNFSVTARDAKENFSANNPIALNATTLVDNTVQMSAAPVPAVDPIKVISVYSDTYNSISSGWEDWYGNTFSTVLLGGNSTLKNTSSCCFGTGFNTATIDISAMTKLHVDIYPENSTSLKFGFVTNAPLDVKKSVSLTGGQWNAVDLSLSELKTLLPTADFTKVKQVGFWDVSGTFYIDNIYFYDDSSTGLNETNSANSIRFYPNPIKNQLTINSRSEIKKIEIRNLTGQLIQSLNTSSFEKSIDMSDFSSGNYLVSVIFISGQIHTQRVVKL